MSRRESFTSADVGTRVFLQRWVGSPIRKGVVVDVSIAGVPKVAIARKDGSLQEPHLHVWTALWFDVWRQS